MIPFFVPEFTKEMENVAIDALKNETSVMGESVTKFEEEFARYIGTKYAISVNSGNAALHLSLISLNIEKDSKVIIQGFTGSEGTFHAKQMIEYLTYL